MTSIVARAGQVSPGAAVHSGSAVSAALNFTTGLRTFHASRRCAVVVGDVGEQVQRDLRVGVAEDGAGADERAVLERDALAGGDLGHGDAGGELRAGLLRGVGDREADHPHAALDVAPHRALALEVALVVHELDRGRAGVLRAAVGGDHALAEQRVLEPLVGRCSRRGRRRSRRRRRCRSSSARRAGGPRSPRGSGVSPTQVSRPRVRSRWRISSKRCS